MYSSVCDRFVVQHAVMVESSPITRDRQLLHQALLSMHQAATRHSQQSLAQMHMEPGLCWKSRLRIKQLSLKPSASYRADWLAR